MKLYHLPKTRASRVTWAANELGETVETQIVNLAEGEHMQPWFLELNPHHKVPVADIDGTIMIESGAICLHLVENSPKGETLFPAKNTSERPLCWQWIVYGPATLDEPTINAFLHKMVYPEGSRNSAVIENGEKQWHETFGPFLSKSLGEKPYLCGDFSMADIMTGYDLFFANQLGVLEGIPNLKAYVGRLTERPAFQNAFGMG